MARSVPVDARRGADKALRAYEFVYDDYEKSAARVL